MMGRTRVAIALGSNLGDRKAYLNAALAPLREDLLEEVQVSSFLETDPWGVVDQPKFLNAVVVGWTEWKPPAILHFLKDLEQTLGRKARVKNGPREIDLDLIAYGESVWVSPEGADVLSVPHPRMANRVFVLKPLDEVWPTWVHPQLKKTPGALLAAAEAKG